MAQKVGMDVALKKKPAKGGTVHQIDVMSKGFQFKAGETP